MGNWTLFWFFFISFEHGFYSPICAFSMSMTASPAVSLIFFCRASNQIVLLNQLNPLLVLFHILRARFLFSDLRILNEHDRFAGSKPHFFLQGVKSNRSIESIELSFGSFSYSSNTVFFSDLRILNEHDRFAGSKPHFFLQGVKSNCSIESIEPSFGSL